MQLLAGDSSVVNGVAPHPYLPYLAICGIDQDAKVESLRSLSLSYL